MFSTLWMVYLYIEGCTVVGWNCAIVDFAYCTCDVLHQSQKLIDTANPNTFFVHETICCWGHYQDTTALSTLQAKLLTPDTTLHTLHSTLSASHPTPHTPHSTFPLDSTEKDNLQPLLIGLKNCRKKSSQTNLYPHTPPARHWENNVLYGFIEFRTRRRKFGS